MFYFKHRKKEKKKSYNVSKKGGGGTPNMVAITAHYPHCDVIMVIGTPSLS